MHLLTQWVQRLALGNLFQAIIILQVEAVAVATVQLAVLAVMDSPEAVAAVVAAGEIPQVRELMVVLVRPVQETQELAVMYQAAVQVGLVVVSLVVAVLEAALV
jgi:hypothetical protein